MSHTALWYRRYRISVMAYVCRHNAEWAILAYGKFPRGEDDSFDWKKVPLDKRDNWGFYCERCARLTFPGVVFHRDAYYRLLNLEVDYENNLPRTL